MDPTSSHGTSHRLTWGAAQRRLLARAREGGDRQAMEELLQQMLPFVRDLAGRYRRWPEPLDDLQQVASLALFRALRRFDPQGGRDFPSFALPAILEALASHRRVADEASSEREVFSSEPSYDE